MTAEYGKDDVNVLKIVRDNGYSKLNYGWDENNDCYHATDFHAKNSIEEIYRDMEMECDEDAPCPFLYFFPSVNKMFIDYLALVASRRTPASKRKTENVDNLISAWAEKLSFIAELKLKLYIFIPEDDPTVGHLIEKAELFENDELVLTSSRF